MCRASPPRLRRSPPPVEPAPWGPLSSVPETLELESRPADERLLDITPEEPEPVAYPAAEAGVLGALPDAEGRTLTGALADALAAMPAAPLPPAIPVTEPEPAPAGLAALPDPEQISFSPAPESEPLRLVGEVFKTYIITERGSELCLIDKHAAHERILFEQLAASYGDVPAQMLLVPVQVNLSAAEKQAVLDHLELLAQAGIEAEDYGGPTVIVRAVPADVPVDDVADMLLELADHLQNGARDALREKNRVGASFHRLPRCRQGRRPQHNPGDGRPGAEDPGWQRAAVLPARPPLRAENYPEGAGKTVWPSCLIRAPSLWPSAGPPPPAKQPSPSRWPNGLGAKCSAPIRCRYIKGSTSAQPRPRRKSRGGVPHHLLDIVEPETPFSVADFTARADGIIRALSAAGKLAIVAGGTGLYITNLLAGTAFAPEKTDPDLRARA